MVTVIEIGGKQYCLTPNQKITINRVDAPEKGTLALSNLLTQEPVTVEVVSHGLSDKVVSHKFRNKTRYHRIKGHRQPISVIQLKANEPKKRAAKATTEPTKEA